MKTNRRILASILVVMMLVSTFFSQVTLSFASTKQNADKRTKIERKLEKTQILVKYKDPAKGADVENQTMSTLGMDKLDNKGSFKRSHIEVLEINESEDINKVVNKLRQNPDVEFAQPNYKLSSLDTAVSDARYNEQWNLNSSAESSSPIDINAPQAWETTKGSPSVLVGVLDTGIDINHPDLAANIYTNSNEISGNGIDDDGNGYIDDVNGWDFYNEDNTIFDNAQSDSHGTHVAGIIAADQNTVGISGVAPQATILPLKFISNGQGYTSDVIAAIEYAKQMGVKIINCSFGGTDNNPALKEAMDNSGILFVCAAGNDGKDLNISPIYPACFDISNIITVGATDNTGAKASFSNYGNIVDVVAPGTNILSTTPNNSYGFMSGTSMAAPHVAGAAALIKSAIPDIQTPEIIARIEEGVRTSSLLIGKVSSGGILDAAKAIATTVSVIPPEENKNDGGKGNSSSGKSGGTLTILAATISPQLQEQIHYGENGVNVGTGNFSKSVTDMTMSAPGFQVNISRTYNSKDDRTTSTMGRGWTFGFEGSFKQDTTYTSQWVAKLPNGSAQVFVRSGNTFTPNDSRSTLVLQADGTYVLTTKDQYTYGFNTTGYLVWMKDKNGNAVNIDVDAQGKVTKITDQVGRSFSVQYDSSNHITKIIDPMGRSVQYAYTNNCLTTVTDPMGFISTYTYDSSNYLTGIKDKEHATVDVKSEIISYDSSTHKVTTYTDLYGVAQSFSYDTTNKKTTITYNGRSIIKWYDAQYYVTQSQDPEGKIASVTYSKDSNGVNVYGEETAITDRNGNTTTYERDANGNITKITNPDSTSSTYVYDTKNNLIKETDESGKITQYIYDAPMLNLQKKIQPLDGTTAYVEGADLSKYAVTTYVYYLAEELSVMGVNAKSLLKSVTDPEGNTTRYTYDTYGNIKTTVDPMGNATTQEYNIIGWVVSVTTPMGYKTQNSYDLNGDLVKQVQANGETTRILYDKMGRKLQEISPNQYDWTKDNLSANTYSDPNMGTRYHYTDQGQVDTETDALGNVTQYTYDVYGNMKTKTMPNLSQYAYDYDVMNRLVKESFKEDNGAATPQTTLNEYKYEILADKTTKNTQTQYLNSTEKAVTSTVYDALGRQILKTYPDGTTEKREYYANGTLKSITDANNAATIMVYDGLNRLSDKWAPLQSAGTDNGVFTPTLYEYTGYTYDRAGRTTAEIYGKDLVELYQKPLQDRLTIKNYEYYGNGKVKTSTDSAGQRIEYAYDKDGNKSKEKTYISTTEYIQKEFKYNDLEKLTEEKLLSYAGDFYPNKPDDKTPMNLTTNYQYDDNGNLMKKTTPDMHSVMYEYDALNRLTATRQTGVDEFGMPVIMETSNTYDNMGNLQTFTGVDGQVTTNEYDKRGNLIKISLTYEDESGQSKTEVRSASAYDLAGRVTIEVNAQDYIDGQQLTDMNRVEHVYDLMGREILAQHVYKVNLTDTQFTTVVSAANRYDKMGNVTKALDGEGYAAGVGVSIQDKINSGYGTIKTYNLAGQVLTVLDPVSKDRGYAYTVKYSYDGMGRKISETYATGSIIRTYYDDDSHVIETSSQDSIDDPEKTLQTSTYNKAGLIATSTDSNGNTTSYTYNSLSMVKKTNLPGDESIPAGDVVYQYDYMGRIALQRDSEGTETINTYDVLGRQIAQTSQGTEGLEPITIKTSYDLKGNPVSKTDGEGNTTTYTYNYLDKVETETSPIGHKTSYTYDKLGNQLTVTDWLNNTNTNSYDSLYRLFTRTDATNKVFEELRYDLSNRQTVSIDGKTNQKQFIYDRNNRVIATIDQEGWITKQSYDAVGNIKTKTDGNGNVTTYNYDAKNNLIQVTNALGEITRYTYDGNGNLLTQTDGNGNTITMTYNARNLLMKKVYPNNADNTDSLLAFTESYKYYSDGTLKEKLDRNDVTTNYSYDAHKRLINQGAGDEKILTTYDNNGNVLSTASGDEITTRTYDPIGRVLTKYVTGIGTANYEYDLTTGLNPGESAEKSIDPKGNETTKVYDQLGRMARVVTKDGTTEYAYDDNGNQEQVVYPGGTKEVYTYLKNNKVQTLENSKFVSAAYVLMDSYSYVYDKAGNQIVKTETINTILKGNTSYTYDKLNRLKEVKEPGGIDTLYQYDKASNRTLELKRNGSLTDTTYYTYDKQNRLTQTLQKKVGETDTTKYFYDNNGNMTSSQQEVVKNADKSTTPHFGMIVIEDEREQAQQSNTLVGNAFYSYNAFNQMVRSTANGQTASYAYNGEGYRTLKKVNGETTRYFYEYDKVVLEVDENGKETAHNSYGINLIERTVNNESLFYLYNGHADVTALTDYTGSVVGSYYYDAFGVIVTETGDKNNPFRYAGYHYDSETGFYYLNSRMYDPKIARFMQEDTYSGESNDPLSLNLYTYCFNNPLIYCDPTGHSVQANDFLDETYQLWADAKAKGDTEAMRFIEQYAESIIQEVDNSHAVEIGGGNIVIKGTDPNGNTEYVELSAKKDSDNIASSNNIPLNSYGNFKTVCSVSPPLPPLPGDDDYQVLNDHTPNNSQMYWLGVARAIDEDYFFGACKGIDNIIRAIQGRNALTEHDMMLLLENYDDFAQGYYSTKKADLVIGILTLSGGIKEIFTTRGLALVGPNGEIVSVINGSVEGITRAAAGAGIIINAASSSGGSKTQGGSNAFEGPELNIDSEQFGQKVGKHAEDYGLDPKSATDRQWIKGHIEDIHSSPDEVRQGKWRGLGDQLPNGNRGQGDALFYRQGNDVVVTDMNGNFVTILKDGIQNSFFKGGTSLYIK